jgi:hypothetical protein
MLTRTEGQELQNLQRTSKHLPIFDFALSSLAKNCLCAARMSQ